MQNRDDAASSMDLNAEHMVPGVIAIGRVGPLRNFSNQEVFDDAYTRYETIMISIGRSEKILSEDELRSLAGGWTTITLAGVPQLGFVMTRAYVAPEDVERIDFSSVAGTVFGGAREDLVAAHSTLELPFYLIKELLCEDGQGYSECAENYDPGRYDIFTGRELTEKYKIKNEGVVISTETYKISSPN